MYQENFNHFGSLNTYPNTETNAALDDLGNIEFREVILHDTKIGVVSWDRGKLLLNHGGHKTGVTKRRMNQFLNAVDLRICVVQRDREWYVVKRADLEKGEFDPIAQFDGESVTINL